MHSLSDDELQTLIEVIDVDLQGADDVEKQIFSDKVLTSFEEMLELVADHKSRTGRLRALQAKAEEERERRQRTAGAQAV